MTTETTAYTIDIGFDRLEMTANLSEASHTIGYEVDGEWTGTPYQTADARHDATEAAVLLVQHLGPDYWHDPGDEMPDDVEAHIRGMIVSVVAS